MNAIISTDPSIFTLINTFDVEADASAAIVESLRDFTERVTQDLAGFISSSVHVSLDRTRVVNYVQWRSEQDFAAMFRISEAQAHMRAVSALAKQVTPVFYSVAYVRVRQTGEDG